MHLCDKKNEQSEHKLQHKTFWKRLNFNFKPFNRCWGRSEFMFGMENNGKKQIYVEIADETIVNKILGTFNSEVKNNWN